MSYGRCSIWYRRQISRYFELLGGKNDFPLEDATYLQIAVPKAGSLAIENHAADPPLTWLSLTNSDHILETL